MTTYLRSIGYVLNIYYMFIPLRRKTKREFGHKYEEISATEGFCSRRSIREGATGVSPRELHILFANSESELN